MISKRPLQLLVALFTVAVVGCGAMGPRAPLYPGGPSAEPTDMRPIEQNGFEMALPAGWETQPVASNLEEVVKVAFRKSNTSVHGQLQCHSPFLTVQDAGITMEEAVLSVSGNARLTRGPYALSDSLMAPVVAGYEGTVTSKGREKDFSFWIAYNIGDMNCQYGVFMFGLRGDMSSIEPEFVAIVRSMQ